MLRKYIALMIATCLVACYYAVSYFTANLNQSKWIKMENNQKSSGTFLAKDKLGTPVILEWIKTDIQSPDYVARMKNIAEIAAQAFTSVELQFLRKHPEAVMQDEYLQQYIPFFDKGLEIIDWRSVENKLQSNLRQMHEMDLSSYGPDVLKPYTNDIYFFVTIKDQETETPLGYINYSIAPEYAHGDIKVTGIGIAPSAQNRGLGKLLMSSIFNITSHVKRIFLSTRITNENALRAYCSWGFAQDINPMQEPNLKIIKEHWNYLEYKIENSDELQKTAAKNMLLYRI
jgi:ribosomal protein S18 acetylase RimI-like enzyme